MNLLKRLFRKRKPITYTAREARHRYKEDDPYPASFPDFNLLDQNEAASGNDPEPSQPATNFEGGDFGGAGASGTWESGDSSGSYDSSSSSGDSGESSSE